MKSTRNLNMTTGHPTRLLLMFAIPMLIGNLFQQTYSLADSVIVGQCLGSGAGIVTAQYFGAGLHDRTRRAIANAAYMMVLGSLVMAAAAYLAAPWALQAQGVPAELLPDAITYMRMSCIGVPLVALVPQLGMDGIWYTTFLTWIISAASCLMRYAVWYKKADFTKSVV